MPRTIRYGLVGVRHPHAALHLRTLQLMPEVESILLCDEDPDAARALRAKSPDKVDETPVSFRGLLRRDDVPAILGCLPTDENGPAMLEAVQAGRHVMSEKPIGISSEIIARIVEEAHRRRAVVSVCYQNRFHPVVQDMRRYVADGTIGAALNVEVRMVTSQVKFRDPTHWLFHRQRSGGGILSWLMCHYFDLIRYVLQDEVVDVTAMTGTLGGDAIDVEDVASGALRLRRGTLGSFNAGYLLCRSVSGFKSPAYDIYFGVKGKEGRLTWDKGEVDKLRVESVAPFWNAASPSRVIEYPVDAGEGYGGAYGMAFQRQFLRAVCEGAEPPTTGEDALAVARILEACYRSNETGRRVAVG